METRAYSSQVSREMMGRPLNREATLKVIRNIREQQEQKPNGRKLFILNLEKKNLGGKPLERQAENKASGVLQAGRDLANMLVRRSKK